MPKISILAFVFLFCLLSSYSVEAEKITIVKYKPEVGELFQKGLEVYSEGAYRQAGTIFQKIIDLPLNQQSSAAQLMLCKSLYKLGDNEAAINAAEKLRKEYPESRYLPYASYILGNCYFRKYEYLKAILHYSEVVKASTDEELKLKVALLTGAVIRNRVSSEDLKSLKELLGENFVNEVTTWNEVVQQILVGDPFRGKGMLGRFVKDYPKTLFSQEVGRVFQLAEQKTDELSKIGLLCPLSGEDRNYGIDLLEGERLAYKHLDPVLKKRIRFVVADSGSDIIKSIKSTQQLIEDENVTALIGPVFGGSTAAASAVANCFKVNMLAPTATEDELTSIGSYVFQLNISPKRQGQKIAEYAIKKLNLKTFAVIASKDSYGISVASNFVKEVSTLGGTVLTSQFYAIGTTDFSSQIEKIKEEISIEIAKREEKETLTVTNGSSNDESQVYKIDGLLIAGGAEEVVQIVPQLTLYGIKTQLLGGSGWNSEMVFRMGTDVEGAVFVTEYNEKSDSPVNRRFLADFKREFGRNPSKVSAFGYDSVSLVSEICRKTVGDREQFNNTLGETRGFKGVTGEISFSDDRSNAGIHVLKIKGGRVLELEPSNKTTKATTKSSDRSKQ